MVRGGSRTTRRGNTVHFHAFDDHQEARLPSSGRRVDLQASSLFCVTAIDSPCQSCGACCAYSADWPRFSTETDEALDLIPLELVDPSLSRMAWSGSRCAALAGEVGKATACTIYEIRPDVCRACQPGDDACAMARERYGMGLLQT